VLREWRELCQTTTLRWVSVQHHHRATHTAESRKLLPIHDQQKEKKRKRGWKLFSVPRASQLFAKSRRLWIQVNGKVDSRVPEAAKSQ